MCPYARFQSAMFDKDTLIISYDAERGEPRGSRSRKADHKALGKGDCIDCGLCVQVCPTGIDIRKGLQYECIGCTACIDVCNGVMDKMNYPRGLIFAGDAGAYLWGLLIAAISLQLVQRHPIVSPWFPMLLLIYPVWETLFSIYRKLARGGSPGMADALHLHQLVYRRLVSSVLHEDEAKNMLARNNRTAPYLWGFIVLTVVPALLFWRYSGVLLAFCVLFAVSYVAAYLALIRFKVPKVFRSSRY